MLGYSADNLLQIYPKMWRGGHSINICILSTDGKQHSSVNIGIAGSKFTIPVKDTVYCQMKRE